jgi:cell division protein FtsB
MLTAINTKILFAILAALTVIGGAAIYQRDEAAKTAAATAKAAQLLQLQKDDNDYLKQENEALRKQVEADKKQHSSTAAHEGKTWKTYIP